MSKGFTEVTGATQLTALLKSNEKISTIHTCFYDDNDGSFVLLYENEWAEVVQEKTFTNKRVMLDEMKKIPYPNYSVLYGTSEVSEEEQNEKPLLPSTPYPSSSDDDDDDSTDSETSKVRSKSNLDLQKGGNSSNKVSVDRQYIDYEKLKVPDISKYRHSVHTLKFIEWSIPVILNSNDVYLSGGSKSSGLQTTMQKRLNFYHYKPKDTFGFTYESPIFVVLNGPPFSPLISHNLCEILSSKCECISIDCMSASKSFLYGDYMYAIEESNYMDKLGERYNVWDWLYEIENCGKIIYNILKQTPNASSIASRRPIIIISDLYTTHYATVLSGLSILQSYNSNIVTVYLTGSVFPKHYVQEKKDIANETFFTSTTESMSKLNAKDLRKQTITFVKDHISETVIPLDRYLERESMSAVLNKAIIDDILFNVSLRGFPEKSKFIFDRCTSYSVMKSVIKNILTYDKDNKNRYVYFCGDNESKDKLTNTKDLFNDKISCVEESLNILSINTNPKKSVQMLVKAVLETLSSGKEILNEGIQVIMNEMGSDTFDNDSEKYTSTYQIGSSALKNRNSNKSRMQNDRNSSNNTEIDTDVFPFLSMWHKRMNKNDDTKSN